MEVKCVDNKLVIYWDFDDVFVDSSSHLQEQVDEKTCFKTDTLRLLEQLKRNCEYLRDEVQKECALSFANRRLPHLKYFPTFENVSLNKRYPSFNFGRMNRRQYEEIYQKPIKSCEYYVDVVKALLNQYLEERDSFLEKDNLAKGQIIKYDYLKEKDNFIYFQNLINNNRRALQKISEFCLMEIIQKSLNAKSMHTNKPNYGSLVKMDGNDILRDKHNLIHSDEYFLYEKPVIDIKKTLDSLNLLDDIVKNFAEYYETSQEKINYEEIYSLKNVNWDVVNVILKLEECPFVLKQFILSHHNGSRELSCKANLVKKALKHQDVPFIGVRFHSEEHTGVRRLRNSKFVPASKYCDNPRVMVLVDDSLDNNKDFISHDANSILARRKTISELIQNELEKTPYERITDYRYDEIEGLLKKYYLQANEKQKVKSR